MQRLRGAAIRAEKLLEPSPSKSERGTSSSEASNRFGKRKGHFPQFSSRGTKSGTSIGSGRGWTRTSAPPSGRQGQSYLGRKPQCAYCGKYQYHGGECRVITGACYRCGEFGHLFRDCPMKVERVASENTVEG